MNHPATEFTYEPADDILTRYEVLKKQEPKIRSLDAAQKLGISEGELVAAKVGSAATRLIDNAQEILKSLEPLGQLMALTRNPSCVHERKGIYKNPSFSSHGKMKMGLFNNPDIDLRLFMNHWKFCFAVEESVAGSLPRKSLQFFDKSGVAIHKIYLTPKSNLSEYQKLVRKFKNKDQSNFIEIEQYEPAKPDKKDQEVDWEAFRIAWENLKDTHDFFPMLRKFKVGRVQAFEKIGSDFAYKVNNDATRKILDLAGEKQCEIMVFVGNRGCLQIHTGEIKKLKEFGPWYNVLDPDFNLHLREDAIGETWVTKKPTEDGIVTALEVFDKNGDIITTFFGKRKPGIAELELWREIINEIPAL